MPKPHWTLPGEGTHGCQHSDCTNQATWQWRRLATEDEITAEANTQGPYGDVHRNPEGPHHTAVFACPEHAFPTKEGTPNLDVLALIHDHDCPAPDEGCNC